MTRDQEQAEDQGDQHQAGARQLGQEAQDLGDDGPGSGDSTRALEGSGGRNRSVTLIMIETLQQHEIRDGKPVGCFDVKDKVLHCRISHYWLHSVV